MNKGFSSLGSVIIFGWLGFYGCTAIPENNNSVSIEASLDTNQVTIGDVIHLTVVVRAISNQRLVFSELDVENPIEIREKSIFNEETEIGKVLIDKKYPFAVIKYTSEKFNFDSIFKINNAKVKILKPIWL